MEDHILTTGDKAIFMPKMGDAIVVVRPGILQGSGPTTIGGKKICVEGDEQSLMVGPCIYVTKNHPLPGQGILKIKSIAKDQVAKITNVGGKAVLLKGKKFTSVFEVKSPAIKPPTGPGPPILDLPVNKEYMGEGIFMTTNKIFKGK